MATFSTFTPSFLLHKANATLDRDETFGLARLLAAVDKRDVSAEQIRPSFLLARNVLRHVVALEATGEATAASFRDAENAGDVANTSRPARFPFEPPEAGPRDDPRRDDDPDVCREGADAPPPSDVPAMDPRPRAPADDAAARARHLASANATLAADLAAARADLALLRESAAAPTPSRPPPSFAVASVAADRIAAVDDERRALRAALDASRAECVALRRQLDTNAVTAAARRGDERAYPYDPAERDAAAVAAVARDRALSDLAAAAEADAASRRALAAKCSRSVSKALATCAAMETRLTEEHARRRRAEAAAEAAEAECRGLRRALASATVAASSRLGTPNRGIHVDATVEGVIVTRAERAAAMEEMRAAATTIQRRIRGNADRRRARDARAEMFAEDAALEREETRVEEARVVDEVVDEAVSGVEKAYGALYEVIPGR